MTVEEKAQATRMGEVELRTRRHPPLYRYLPQLQELTTRLAMEIVASLALLADRDGQPVTSWHRMGQVDVAEIAALSMGGLLARQELGLQLGALAPSPMITHEYDGQILLIAPVAEQLALMVLIEDPSRLGYARVALRRAGTQFDALFAAPSAAAAGRS